MKTLRCAIYTRKSSEEGLEQDFNSLHAQREACEAYVLSQTGEGWTALKTQYDDGGISGGTMERPGLKALLSDISAGRVDIVLVYKLDRLTRSLMDFMKIVEVFDRHQVSFVSVTQSFNTTSSMGRLTLNMLLSFAQFEREVTSERIRDKLAASKKKGLWMGGNLPLGYDADGRTLKINEPEAAQVRAIFARYLELKSVHQLAAELAATGVVSKQRQAKAGHTIGGGPMRRGALFHLLSNPVYIGRIPHKKVSYAGVHKAIVDPAVFAETQALLQGNANARAAAAGGAPASPLTGRIYDAAGGRMSPTSSVGSKGRHYRYYVSSSLQLGAKPSPDLARVPAPALEAAIREAVQRLLVNHIPLGDPLRSVRRLDVAGEQVTITFDAEVVLLPGEPRSDGLQRISTSLGAGERAWLDSKQGLKVALPARMSFRGGRKRVGGQFNAPCQTDLTLEACLRRAHRIGRSIGISQIAAALPTDDGAVPDTYSRRIVSLSFLAPDVQRIILTGAAPGRLTKQLLLENEIPLSWSEQRALFGLPAQ